MAENEKKLPEEEKDLSLTEEAPAEETPAEETPAAEEAPAKEAPAEEIPAEEKKEKAPKKGGKKGLLIGIICGAAVAVLVIALVVVALVMGSSAVSKYKEGDYAASYSASKLALFQAKQDKNTIAKAYVVEVLCKEGKYFTGAEILEKTSLSDEEKAAVYASQPELGMCVVGQVVKFGKYETDNNAANGAEDLEWIVLDVTKEDGKARSLLVTKDVIGSPDGWNSALQSKNTSYAQSKLCSWCEDFYTAFTQYDVTLRSKLLKVLVSTEDSSTGVDSGEDVAAYAYALSKEDISRYFTGDLEQYITTTLTAAAKAQGVTAYGADKVAVYYLRNAGKFEDGTQWVTGVNKDGQIDEGLSATSGAYGARVCINVDLGEIK